MKKEEPPITVEQDYPCSAAYLWQALTDVNLMRQWFFDNIPDYRAEVGFQTEFPVDAGERVFHHVWKVTEVEAPRVIETRWNYPGYDGVALVRFEVSGNEEVAHLSFSARVEESFPQDIPEFRRESGVGGWNYFLGERLLAFCVGK